MRETFSQQGKKATAVALAAVLVAAPLGATTLATGVSAYGDESSAAAVMRDAQWVEDTYAQSIVDAVARYCNGEISSAELEDLLNASFEAGEVSQTDLDELLLILKSGLLQDAPAWDSGSDANGAGGESADGAGSSDNAGNVGDAAGGGATGDNADAAGNGGTTDGNGATDNDNATDGGAAGNGATPDGGASAGEMPGDAATTGGDSAPAGDAGTAGNGQPASGSEGNAANNPEGESSAADAGNSAAEVAGEPLPSSGAYTPHHYTQDLTTEKFIAVIGEQARQIAQENDLYASVMIAQAILESASGQSLLAQAPNNNLFGIKGYWHGQCVNMTTWEENREGHYYAIRANFRQYDTLSDSLNDYAALLTKNLGNYYAGAWKSNAATPADACNFLEGRYATSSTYSESLQDLIETYDLTRFDEPLDYELVEAYDLPVVDDETGEAVLDENGEPVMESHDLVDLLAEATSHLGTEYVWGGDTPEEGFDCSGLVQYCYQEALGVTLPRTTYFQWRVGETVDFDELHPGDLLFFEEEGDVHHVALYLGDGCYIHAPQEGEEVKVSTMEEYMPSFAKRIVDTKPVDEEVDVAAQEAKAEVLHSNKEKTQTALSGMIWSLVNSISRMSIG